jgi:hypothetical protein
MASLYTLSLKLNIENIRYVGITKYDDVEIRLKAHKEKVGRVNRPVTDWIAKYGNDVVIIKLAGDLSWDEACLQEIELIAKLKNEGFNLLNMTSGGDGSLGKKDSEETKRKKSISSTGRVFSDESKKKISIANTGKKRSDESKKKMSDARKGKPLSPEHVEKIRKKLIGRKCKPETAKKISDAQKGKKLSDNHVANLKIAQAKRRERERQEKQDRQDEKFN